MFLRGIGEWWLRGLRSEMLLWDRNLDGRGGSFRGGSMVELWRLCYRGELVAVGIEYFAAWSVLSWDVICSAGDFLLENEDAA